MTNKTDSQIQQDVIRELKWDTRVDETDVGVEVDRGVVTLTGTVDSWAKKLAAQEAAHRVAGVLDVANDVRIKIPGYGERTDTEIAQAVRSALEWDVFVPDARIQSTVAHGGVTLTGTVDHYRQRLDAERAIRNLQGVHWVENRIEVKSQVSPTTIRASIEEALERHAERAAGKIHLDVVDGKVTVTGTAGSWGERNAIGGAVTGTPGVTVVDNRIRVLR